MIPRVDRGPYLDVFSLVEWYSQLWLVFIDRPAIALGVQVDRTLQVPPENAHHISIAHSCLLGAI